MTMTLHVSRNSDLAKLPDQVSKKLSLIVNGRAKNLKHRFLQQLVYS